jgi:hypothetical protein
VRVLLLGGTGLISTAIVAQLVEPDVEVHVWDRGLSEDRLPGNVVQRVVYRREIHWGRGAECMACWLRYRSGKMACKGDRGPSPITSACPLM